MKVYVASSWRNEYQQEVVTKLRDQGYDVYDFKSQKNNFHWSEVDGGYKTWTKYQYREALNHSVSEKGFKIDMDALTMCDVCVLVLPCGRSAHIEAGWACGAGKPVLVLLAEENEPELMYKMVEGVCVSLDEVIAVLRTLG